MHNLFKCDLTDGHSLCLQYLPPNSAINISERRNRNITVIKPRFFRSPGSSLFTGPYKQRVIPAADRPHAPRTGGAFHSAARPHKSTVIALWCRPRGGFRDLRTGQHSCLFLPPLPTHLRHRFIKCRVQALGRRPWPLLWAQTLQMDPQLMTQGFLGRNGAGGQNQ